MGISEETESGIGVEMTILPKHPWLNDVVTAAFILIITAGFIFEIKCYVVEHWELIDAWMPGH